MEKAKQNDRGPGDKKQACNEPNGDEYLKNGLLNTLKPSVPQPRFYCVHSIHLETQTAHVDFEFYWVFQGQRQKICLSPKEPEITERSTVWLSVKWGWRYLTSGHVCDCSAHMNHSVTCSILPPTPHYHQDTELGTHMRNQADFRGVKSLCIFAERTLANICHVFQPISQAACHFRSVRVLNTNQYFYGEG